VYIKSVKVLAPRNQTSGHLSDASDPTIQSKRTPSTTIDRRRDIARRSYPRQVSLTRFPLEETRIRPHSRTEETSRSVPIAPFVLTLRGVGGLVLYVHR